MAMAEDSDKIFKLYLLTPGKIAFSGRINYLKAPGLMGYFGVLANHAPLLAALKVGEIEIGINGDRQLFAISGGYVEVLSNNVRLLAETAEPASEIDVERAKAAKERAEKRLSAVSPDTDFDRAKIALFRAINRINIAGKM